MEATAKKHIPLSIWTNYFSKAMKLLPHDNGSRLKELFAEFNKYFTEQQSFMTLGESTAFRQLGYKMQTELKKVTA